jgi:peroxiredoxin
MFNPEKPPELQVEAWLNTTKPLTLAKLRGRVVVLVAFQMLCPGCVSHALPQARKLAERFADDEVAVIGLHTVFEHHAAMPLASLKAFVHEYRWPFPIAVDRADGEGLPLTMAAYEMRGTPTLLLFDRQGRLRRHYLGQVDDIRIAAEIMALALEDREASREASVEIERKLATTLVDPAAHGHHHHDHAHDHTHGDDCGCDHDHGAVPPTPAKAKG